MPSPTTPVEILLVDDNRDDAEFMAEALRESTLDVRVAWVEDGEEAMHYLRRQDPYPDATRPDLILLDLHLPRKNGREVLEELMHDPDLRRIPVVVMTSCDTGRADGVADGAPAKCYVSKPAGLEEFARAVKKIEQFWLHGARLASGR
jgi:two-component system response regulator